MLTVNTKQGDRAFGADADDLVISSHDPDCRTDLRILRDNPNLLRYKTFVLFPDDDWVDSEFRTLR